jgi:ABC-type Na+ efflux pump permease subunit
MAPGHFGVVLAVARKELLSSLRDRQTVLYAVVIPLLLYPVILWALVQGALVVQGRDEHTAVTVGLAAEAPADLPRGLFAAIESPPGARAGVERVGVLPAPGPMGPDAAREWLAGSDGLDAVLWIPARGQGGGAAYARLLHDGTERASRLARERVLARLEPFALDLRTAAVHESGGNPEGLIPFEVEVTNVAAERDMLAYLLAFLLPALVVVMCVMGAFFPAVDLTAGELERSTAETTLLLPVPRLAVHQGKILAVCVSALLACVLNLAALGFSVGHLLDLLSGGTLSLTGFPFLALASLFPLALLFSFFASSVLTGLAALTRSFAEGQALLGPVQIVFIVPALVGVIPGIELTPALCLVPVANAALAFRALLLGQALPAQYALVALSLLLYGLAALRGAVWLLDREELLGGHPRPRKRLFFRRRLAHGG